MKLSSKHTATAALGLITMVGFGTAAIASGNHTDVDDSTIAEQRAMLAKNTEDKGFGPQAPRDIGQTAGNNDVVFTTAPAFGEMNLCNIHFHESAEHKGGQFTKSAGNGDGEGNGGGFEYNGAFTEAELAPIPAPIGVSDHGELEPGDTIEVHYVYSTAQIEPGPTLKSCLSDAINNPQLRVVAQVFALVNDSAALNFEDLTTLGVVNGYHQATGMISGLGTPVEYAGSTTGPKYNEEASPFQVTWSVHPEVAKLDINSVGKWLENNEFDEDHAHGIRNLVTNLELLSPIAN
ncbi:delta-class carbonic anhydrase [Aliiroseovarius sp. 2305UL8-7]|uniref:delta-class carbonic anhydrase n=1 Tax=Aliiroseovarius conchicola TaxID=3121637 RepID=UPI00352939AD